MAAQHRYLFLYTELAGYTISCLKALAARADTASIHVVHYPVNPEAPFKFNLAEVGSFVGFDEFKSYDALRRFTEKLNPTHIICCGWIERTYLKICASFKSTTVCILTIDNQLTKSWKQLIWKFTGAVYLRMLFSHVWVPGERQAAYAQYLGFSPNQVLEGYYAADTEFFTTASQAGAAAKAIRFPKVLLCVARYTPVKAYEELWNAFVEWQSRQPSDWELWCAGTGENFDTRTIHPKIKHIGFVQPHDMSELIDTAGVFVLLSKFEPWGVVVHEFAAAGFPLFLSHQVGAGDRFLSEKNGWRLSSHNREQIIEVLQLIAQKEDHELLKMGEESRKLAAEISPYTWAEVLAGTALRSVH